MHENISHEINGCNKLKYLILISNVEHNFNSKNGLIMSITWQTSIHKRTHLIYRMQRFCLGGQYNNYKHFTPLAIVEFFVT